MDTFDVSVLIKIISSWQVIIVSLAVMIILPVIFYIASLDKRPVEIAKKPSKKAGKKSRARTKTRKEKDESADNAQPQERRRRRESVDESADETE